MLPRERFSSDTQGLLAAADSFHAHHPDQRVVFAAAVTRWLHGQGFEWRDLDVDFFAALCDLDERAPALLIEAAQLTIGVVANAATQCTVRYADGGSEPLDRHVEPVRTALLQALVRNWPVHPIRHKGGRDPRRSVTRSDALNRSSARAAALNRSPNFTVTFAPWAEPSPCGARPCRSFRVGRHGWR